jgi:hypothetical protein
MNRCQAFEIELSAWVDGELTEVEARAVVDHLAMCSSCRDFYLAIRGLDAVMGELGSAREADLPPGLWARIERTSREPASVHRIASARPAWRMWSGAALKVAAVVVAAAGLLVVARDIVMPRSDDGRVVTIRVASDPSGMSDDRFLAVAGELLRADPRYHEAMRELLGEVERMRPTVEGSFDRTVVAADRHVRQAGDDRAPGRRGPEPQLSY